MGPPRPAIDQGFVMYIPLQAISAVLSTLGLGHEATVTGSGGGSMASVAHAVSGITPAEDVKDNYGLQGSTSASDEMAATVVRNVPCWHWNHREMLIYT
jgi:hypothetical protein